MKCLYCEFEDGNIDNFINHAEPCMLKAFKRDDYFTFSSIKARRLPYYGDYRFEYPIHHAALAHIHQHQSYKDGNIDKDFSRDFKGLIKLINYLGAIPDNIKNPSVGRIDHSLGYLKGNFAWQELLDNCRESGNRIGYLNLTHTKSPDYKKHLSLKKFLSEKIGRFHIMDICKKFNYSNGRHILELANKEMNCKIENYKNRNDCFIIINGV
jgi:hypothetical protein